MVLQILPQGFSIIKMDTLGDMNINRPFFFFARTDAEFSLVCPTDDAPAVCHSREDGYRALRVKGPLDFSLVGILAALTGTLAQAEIPVFAISTFDTDYLFIREERFEKACLALSKTGCEFKF